MSVNKDENIKTSNRAQNLTYDLLIGGGSWPLHHWRIFIAEIFFLKRKTDFAA